MDRLEKVGDLEINQDFKYQNSWWKVQRIGWGLMGLLALAALGGLLGGAGPLNWTKVGRDPLSLEYERFGRFQSTMKLRIHLGQTVGKGGQFRVGINQSYLENFELQQVTPPPDTVEAGPQRFVYVFRQERLNERTSITFYLEPESVGLVPGEISISDEEPLHFKQFIYP